MLILKEDINPKELEKFGLKPRYDEFTGEIIAYEKEHKTSEFFGIKIKPAKLKPKFRMFKLSNTEWVVCKYRDYLDIDTLYDLIEAGFIKKINKN